MSYPRPPHPVLRGLWRRGGAVGRWSREMDRATATFQELERTGSPPALEPPDALLEPLLRDVDLGPLVVLTGVLDAHTVGADGPADEARVPGRRPFADGPPPGGHSGRAPSPPRPGDDSPARRPRRPRPAPSGAAERARPLRPDQIPAAEATHQLPDPPRGEGSWSAPPDGAMRSAAGAEATAKRRPPRNVSAEEAHEALRRRATGTGAWDRPMAASDGAVHGEEPTHHDSPVRGVGGGSELGAVPRPADERRRAASSPEAAAIPLPAGAHEPGGSIPAPPTTPPHDAGRDTLSRVGEVVARLELRARSDHHGGGAVRAPRTAATDPQATARPRVARMEGSGRGSSVAPASSDAKGLTGLRGLAARAAGASPDRDRTDPPGASSATRPPGWADEAELDERIGAILRREAHNQGIDLDGVGP